MIYYYSLFDNEPSGQQAYTLKKNQKNLPASPSCIIERE